MKRYNSKRRRRCGRKEQPAVYNKCLMMIIFLDEDISCGRTERWSATTPKGGGGGSDENSLSVWQVSDDYNIKGSRPEWYMSSMLYSPDMSFLSGTLNISCGRTERWSATTPERGGGVQTRTACSVWQVSDDSISCGRTERWSTATPKEGGGGCRQEQPAVCDKCLVIVFPVAGQRDEAQQPQKKGEGGADKNSLQCVTSVWW